MHSLRDEYFFAGYVQTLQFLPDTRSIREPPEVQYVHDNHAAPSYGRQHLRNRPCGDFHVCGQGQ